jgi:cytochrome P450
VVGFEAASEVLRNATDYSSTILADTFGYVWGPTMIQMDAPDHPRYRQLIQKAFTRREMERWEHEIARPLLREFIARFVAEESTDLLRDLLMSFPAAVMGTAIGLPSRDLPRFYRLAVEMSNIAFEPERALAATDQLAEYLQEQIAGRRNAAGPDLLSQLVHARLSAEESSDGVPQQLTDLEIISFVRLLLIAGAETTARSSATMMLLLLRHPEQFEAVRADPALIPKAIEESLRYEPPLLVSTRNSLRETVLEDVPIPENAAVQVMLGAANRDSARWERPDDFDIFRPLKAHLAFIAGPHVCLGMHLARMEMRVVLEEILAAMPDIRLDAEQGDGAEITGRDLRAPTAVPVSYGPAPVVPSL